MVRQLLMKLRQFLGYPSLLSFRIMYRFCFIMAPEVTRSLSAVPWLLLRAKEDP